jgi:hypothetical protein
MDAFGRSGSERIQAQRKPPPQLSFNSARDVNIWN